MMLKGMAKVEEETVEWESTGAEGDSEGAIPDSKVSKANKRLLLYYYIAVTEQ